MIFNILYQTMILAVLILSSCFSGKDNYEKIFFQQCIVYNELICNFVVHSYHLKMDYYALPAKAVCV